MKRIADVKMPQFSSTEAAGIDFYVPNDYNCVVQPNQSVNIPSGIKANIPKGWALIAFNKSGVAVKQHFQVGACVVDSDYTGEIHLHVFNVGDMPMEIKAGQKLVQFIMIQHASPMIIEEDFEKETERGDGCFGSTGHN